ncbi:MAG: PAS domain-containing protein [Opitutaceae bacterium]|jgi:hypothetical protein|nr:PAS domain-containing protein [Opitutaceae bacterium]
MSEQAIDWREAPCGLLRVADDGQLLAMNAHVERLLKLEAERPLRLDDVLAPASRLYHELSVQPALRLSGHVDEVFMEFRDREGGTVPLFANIRRDGAAGHADWAVMKVEQRGRWEAAVVEARQRAEREGEKLAAANAELERVLAQLKESNWLLEKVAEVLPTCMYCGRVKTNGRDWESAIDFLKRHSRFLSHGCCPTCVSVLRAQLNLPPE